MQQNEVGAWILIYHENFHEMINMEHLIKV